MGDDAAGVTLLTDVDDARRAAEIGLNLKGHKRGLPAEEKIRWSWNSEIASRSDTLGILKVYEWHATQFTAVNAVTALHRIARSSDFPVALGDERFPELVGYARGLVMEASGTRQFSNMLWALAKILYLDYPLFDSIAAQSLRMISSIGPQGLSNMVWSFATILVENKPLSDSISAAAMRRIHHFNAQNIGNTAWAFSKLNILDVPLMSSIARQALRKLQSWETQELVNTAWAFAKLELLHGPLMTATSAAAMRRLSQFAPQDLVTMAWSLAMLWIIDQPLLDSISASSMPNISDFRPQHLSLLAWSFAVLCLRDGPLIDAIASESIAKIGEFGVLDSIGSASMLNCNNTSHCQDIALTAWAFAALSVFNLPLLTALSSASINKISEFNCQNLSNTSWALANLKFPDRPLLNALSAPSIPMIVQFDAQNMANSAWAFAKLLIEDLPLFAAIASAARSRITDCNPQEIANIAWSFAVLALFDYPLMASLSSEVINKLVDFDAQHLANTLWAWAALVLQDEPLMKSLSPQALSICSDYTMQELSNSAWSCATLSGNHTPLLDAIAEEAQRMLRSELRRAITHSIGSTCRDLEAALLFDVNAGQLAWSYTFLSQADRPLLPHVHAAILELGRAFDINYMQWDPHSGVRGAFLGTAASLERPFIHSFLPGMCLVLKPPGWEVDTEGDSGLPPLSSFLQASLPDGMQAVAYRPDFSFGFIHRLDTPSSGLILTGTSFEGYSHLEWQMYTYKIQREYFVAGHGAAKVGRWDVAERILDVKTATVAENGRPARSSIKFSADAVRGAHDGSLEFFCLVSIGIFTGRRHQIRVHMRWCQCPVVTDFRYSPDKHVFLGPLSMRTLLVPKHRLFLYGAPR